MIDFIFNDEVLIEDDGTLNAYLEATDSLVDLFCNQNHLNLIDLDNLNFYVDYNVLTDSIKLTAAFYIYGEPAQQLFPVNLPEENMRELIRVMNEYCINVMNADCFKTYYNCIHAKELDIANKKEWNGNRRVISEVHLTNGKRIVLAENLKSADHYVTWESDAKGIWYSSGHYFVNKNDALVDLYSRAAEKESIDLKEHYKQLDIRDNIHFNLQENWRNRNEIDSIMNNKILIENISIMADPDNLDQSDNNERLFNIIQQQYDNLSNSYYCKKDIGYVTLIGLFAQEYHYITLLFRDSERIDFYDENVNFIKSYDTFNDFFNDNLVFFRNFDMMNGNNYTGLLEWAEDQLNEIKSDNEDELDM